MGKVWDALQRADEQRSQRKAETAGALSRLPADWAGAAGGRVGRPPFWRRWFARLAAAPGAEDAGAANKRRIALLEPDSFVAEQFRTLRARIDSIAAQRPIRTIAVTSALAGEGKTTAAINLALVTSMRAERRVLLVDCDLRKPKVHRSLGLRPEAGLAEVLLGQSTLDQALCKVEGTNLEVLAVRNQPGNPSELLASEAMRRLIEETARRFNPVILDVPATLALPDAKTVSELTDGLILVVRADSTSQEDVHAALDILDRRHVLGLVLNGVQSDTRRYGYQS